jgi:hypothetical protein
MTSIWPWRFGARRCVASASASTPWASNWRRHAPAVGSWRIGFLGDARRMGMMSLMVVLFFGMFWGRQICWHSRTDRNGGFGERTCSIRAAALVEVSAKVKKIWYSNIPCVDRCSRKSRKYGIDGNYIGEQIWVATFCTQNSVVSGGPHLPWQKWPI